MEENMALEGAGTNSAPHVSAANLPLSMVEAGTTAVVSKVRGSKELRQHLAEMGFIEGAEVKVVSRVNGDCIVSVKGATFGLNRTMTSHISVY